MERLDIPFNIRLLVLTPKKLEGLRPVTALDIFDSPPNFHPDGLFSTLIFGRVGDERRSLKFSYINIKIPVFHPVVFKCLADLKRLYAGILAGTDYAIWNPDIKDFEKATATTGKTGYAFFLQYWKQIEFADSKSDTRQQNIELLKKYESRAMTDHIVVMPAGLRDVEIDNGRVVMDDINGLYQTMLRTANALSDSAVRTNPETLNISRWRLQVTFNQLYDYVEAMVKGKKKLLLSGWASRAVNNGTRNVITAMETATPILGGKGQPDFNTTIVGLYQASKAALPISLFCLKTGFLSKVFFSPDAPVKLVNKKSLRVEEVKLKPQYYDRFMTDEGLEKVLTSFGTEDVRHKPIEIEGRYLGLIYKGPDGSFRLLQDIGEVPLERDRKHVYPLTFCELLYCSIYRKVNGLPCFITRYPVTGIGSIYPSKTLIQPTIKVEKRHELGMNWEEQDESYIAYKFPVNGSAFVNSFSPHSSKLAGLGADFDGDMGSLTIVYSDEGVRDCQEFFKSKRAYVGTNGNFISSFDTSTVALVFHNLTSPVVA